MKRPDIATTLVLADHGGVPHVLMVREPRPIYEIDTRTGRARRTAVESALVLPGGHVEPGETPSTAARRELEEETGLRASELVALGTYTTADHVVAAYYARDAVGVLRRSEEGDPTWVHLRLALVSAHGRYVAWLVERATAAAPRPRESTASAR
jgi:8-oxo-dGTP pyrophosphatase MutT (NUDIX family)